MGVQGIAQNATPDVGRFSFILNPVFDSVVSVFDLLKQNWMFALQDGVNNTALWSNQWVAGVLGTNFCSYFQDVNQNTFVNSTNNGLMMKCRPVSASILATYNGQILNGAGNIAAAWVPGDWWVMRGVNSTMTSTKWETVALYKGAYDGPLEKGAYIVYVPEDETDTLLYDTTTNTANNMKSHQYPNLLVCGQVGAPSGGFSGSTQLRLDCYINWEYTTESRVVETMHGSKDISERYLAFKMLADADLSMANAEHVDWIRTILGGVFGFVIGGPVGAAIGAASGAGLSLAGALAGKQK